MPFTIAAVRSGTDPSGPLPAGSFHRWLEEPIYCPRCDATYNLVVDYARANDRYFPEESRRHILLLRKAITHEHNAGHPTSHFETAGVVINRIKPQR